MHTCHLDARAVLPDELDAKFAELERAARAGGRRQEVEWLRSAELRYGGQTWEVEVELPGRSPPGRADRGVRGRARAALRRARRAGRAIVIRALRLAALAPSSAVDRLSLEERPPTGRGARDGALAARSRRRCARARRSAPVRSRADAVDEYDTTVVVRPGWTGAAGRVDGDADPGAARA